MREPAWRQGFGLLRGHGLSFDLQIYPAQTPEAAGLAREHPETAIVLNHTGMFVDRSTVAGWRQWRDGMRELASCPNISAKVSGLGMLDHRWTVESLRPLVLETIDAFGVGRCMFASNFPVDSLLATFDEIYGGFLAITRDMPDDVRRKLFHDNAARIYRL